MRNVHIFLITPHIFANNSGREKMTMEILQDQSLRKICGLAGAWTSNPGIELAL